MAEVAEESTHAWSSKPRTVMFLAAMRHFALAQKEARRPLHCTRLDAPGNAGSLGAQLQADILRLKPARLVVTAPGDWRVLQAIKAVTTVNGQPLNIREDRQFFCSVRDFAAHAKGRKSLRMEYFYREQRKRHGVLMLGNDPVGNQWNFDADNREAFGAAGPGAVRPRTSVEPDAVTREVIALVYIRFAQHPGHGPVCRWRRDGQQALYRHRKVHPAHEPALQGLPLRPRAAQRSGDNACPFTTLYWDFLMRHEVALAKNPRMAAQVKNMARLTDVQKQAVNEPATAIGRGEVGVEVGVQQRA